MNSIMFIGDVTGMQSSTGRLVAAALIGLAVLLILIIGRKMQAILAILISAILIGV